MTNAFRSTKRNSKSTVSIGIMVVNSIAAVSKYVVYFCRFSQFFHLLLKFFGVRGSKSYFFSDPTTKRGGGRKGEIKNSKKKCGH